MKSKKYINAAKEIIEALVEKKMTIAAAREAWFVACEAEPAIRHIANKYRTKAQIVAGLESTIAWLNSFGRVNDVEAAHAEALVMDAEHDAFDIVEAAHAEALEMNLMANIQAEVMEKTYLPALVEACHAEALEVNTAIDVELRGVARSIASAPGDKRQRVTEEVCLSMWRWVTERWGVALAPSMLPLLVERACK